MLVRQNPDKGSVPERRPRLLQHAAHPHGSFYVLADVSRATGPATIEFARRLVLEHGVAVAPGETFGPGAAGCVRLSLAADQAAIAEGVRRLAHAVDYARVG